MARQPALSESAATRKLRSTRPSERQKICARYLQKLIEYDPKQLLVVDKEIDPVFEATAIVDQLRTDGRYSDYPAVLFRKIQGVVDPAADQSARNLRATRSSSTQPSSSPA